MDFKKVADHFRKTTAPLAGNNVLIISIAPSPIRKLPDKE
jgi:hypothetical protein